MPAKSKGKSMMPIWEQPAHVDKIRAMVADGMTDKRIAAAIGVTTVTLSAWRKRSPIIAAAMYRSSRPGVVGLPRGSSALDPAALADKIEAYIAAAERKERPLTLPDLLTACGLSDNEYAHIMDDHPAALLSQGIENRSIESREGMTTREIVNAINCENIEANRRALQSVIKKAMRRVESSYLYWAIVKRSAGAIFALKNHFGYTDLPRPPADGGTLIVQWSGAAPFLDTRKASGADSAAGGVVIDAKMATD